MRVAFLLESADISGGTFVIFEHALRMMRNGVNVFIITEKPVSHDQLFWHPEARALDWLTYGVTKDTGFDIVVSTWWRTAFNMHLVQAEKYIYFVQSIEYKFYPETERALRHIVKGSYLLPVNYITEATWIRKYLKNHFGHQAYLVHNGIRKDIYNPHGDAVSEKKSGTLRVLVEGHLNVWFKNTEKTIMLCKQSNADEIWLLTGSDVESYKGVDKTISKVSIEETAKVYRSCDVLVKLSYVEGMFGPPLEMFHCGGTAIVYDVAGYDEYIKHNINGLVVKTGEEKKVVEYINLLKSNKELLVTLKKEALKTADSWPEWATQTEKFEDTLKDIKANGSNITPLQLKNQCLYLKRMQSIIHSEHSKIYNTRSYKLASRISNTYQSIARIFKTIKSVFF